MFFKILVSYENLTEQDDTEVFFLRKRIRYLRHIYDVFVLRESRISTVESISNLNIWKRMDQYSRATINVKVNEYSAGLDKTYTNVCMM